MEKIFNTSVESPTNYIAQKLIDELVKKNLSVSFVEGCTGGKLNTSITIPGSTRAFHMGMVPYSRSSKIDLGVPEAVINKYGEYSPEVAVKMAQSVRRWKSDLVISTVGQLSASRPFCHVAYSFLKKPVVVETLHFNPGPKPEIKTKLTETILLHAYSLINHGHIKRDQNEKHFVGVPVIRNASNHRAQFVIELLKKMGLRISTMESCTGGEIASCLTDVDCSSEVFDSAYITYDENIKQSFGVPFSSMYNGGVYSKQVAYEMARAVMLRTNTDISIGTTGIMETMDTRPFHSGKPGSIYISILIQNQNPIVKALKLHPTLTTTREQLKEIIVNHIFDLLINRLSAQKKDDKVDYSSNLYI